MNIKLSVSDRSRNTQTVIHPLPRHKFGVGVKMGWGGGWEREQRGLCLYWQERQLAGPSGQAQHTSKAVRSPP